jgi:hypothetical protein
MTVFETCPRLVLVLPIGLLLGCPPATEDPPPAPAAAVWEEDDDETNGFPTDAEPVDITWTDTLTINGVMEDCGYDNDEDWPWTGDEDNFRIEVPEAGYIDALLTWEHNSDLDLLVYYSPPSGGGAISPDESLSSSGDNGEIEFLFDEPYDRGDDFVLTVLCASGAGGDYVLTVNWES